MRFCIDRPGNNGNNIPRANAFVTTIACNRNAFDDPGNANGNGGHASNFGANDIPDRGGT